MPTFSERGSSRSNSVRRSSSTRSTAAGPSTACDRAGPPAVAQFDLDRVGARGEQLGRQVDQSGGGVLAAVEVFVFDQHAVQEHATRRADPRERQGPRPRRQRGQHEVQPVACTALVAGAALRPGVGQRDRLCRAQVRCRRRCRRLRPGSVAAARVRRARSPRRRQQVPQRLSHSLTDRNGSGWRHGRQVAEFSAEKSPPIGGPPVTSDRTHGRSTEKKNDFVDGITTGFRPMPRRPSTLNSRTFTLVPLTAVEVAAAR